METKEITRTLLSMIGTVCEARSPKQAAVALFDPLLRLFDMDQAALCLLKDNGEIEVRFAMDWSRKFLDLEHQLWISSTVVERSFVDFEPVVYRPSLLNEDGVAKSISENALKSIVCIPLSAPVAPLHAKESGSRESRQFLYLASRRDPYRKFTAEELSQLKVAGQAGLLALDQSGRVQGLRQSNEKLRQELDEQKPKLVFASQGMEKIVQELRQIAPYRISVLIQGESGTGKELIAREIHRLSELPGKFVAINCANLTESLLESELFGYVKGAFTGALSNKKGLIQEAHQGTFFLDEIGEFPLNLQAKLLRVLQEGVVRPLGATAESRVEVRFLAATHRNLERRVQEGAFREDLLFRIQEFVVAIPPLRERPEDLELLSQRFANEYAHEFKQPDRLLSAKALEKLHAHRWPGNVRELQNAIRMAVILSKGLEISEEAIRIRPPLSAPPDAGSAATTASESVVSTSDREAMQHADLVQKALRKWQEDEELDLKGLARDFERQVAKDLLSAPGASQASVSKRLGVSVRTLQRILDV